MLTIADIWRELVHRKLLLLMLEAKGRRFYWCRDGEVGFAAFLVIGNRIAVVIETFAVHFPAVYGPSRHVSTRRVTGFRLTLPAR